MRRVLTIASVVLLLPPVYLALVLLTPWCASRGLEFRAPWTTVLGLGQILAFPVLVSGAMAFLFAVWLGLGWWSRHRSRTGRAIRPVPAIGVVLSVLGMVLALNPVADNSSGPSDGRTITLVSWNVHDELSRDDLERLVADDPEVVVLPEASTSSLETNLARLGKGGEYQVFATETKPGVAPTTVMVSKSLGEYEVSEGTSTTLGTLTVTPRDPDSGQPVILGVHTASPVPRWMGQWDDDVGHVLDAVCPADGAAASQPVIAAGDYNANPWHGHMAGITARSGCTDALPASGASRGTWPRMLPAWARTQIDHVVVNGGVRVLAGSVMPIEGASDHVPVTATLRY